MADTKTHSRRDAGSELTNVRGSSRPGSITQDGKDINTPLSHEDRMEGVNTQAGHQGTSSTDYQPNRPDQDRGGFGMQDTDRQPGKADAVDPDEPQARYGSDEDRSRGSVSAQPGQEKADVTDQRPEHPGHGTAEGKAQTGKGNDERGEYGRGS